VLEPLRLVRRESTSAAASLPEHAAGQGEEGTSTSGVAGK